MLARYAAELEKARERLEEDAARQAQLLKELGVAKRRAERRGRSQGEVPGQHEPRGRT